MRVLIHLSIIFLIALNVFAQNAFDKSVGEATTDLANKLIQLNKKTVVVLYVTDNQKEQSTAGNYIVDEVSYNIENPVGRFEVFNRVNLSGIAEAKKLIAEGYIDVGKTKELGKILSVETIIIGTYTVLSNTLKLYLKALDSNTGFVIASTMKDLKIDLDAGALLGINIEANVNTNNSSRGFNNRPLNSNEDYNNPNTVNPKCKANNTGDYCFENNTKFKLTITLLRYNRILKTSTFQPGQKQCFYDLEAGSADYDITAGQPYRGRNYDPNAYDYKANGQVYIEQCKSKTFVIK